MSDACGVFIICSSEREIKGSWDLAGEDLNIEICGHKYKIASGDDLSENLLKTFKAVNKKLHSNKYSLKGCITCKNFMMSSMARDMGRGQRGVCNLDFSGVEICYVCDMYQSTSGS